MCLVCPGAPIDECCGARGFRSNRNKNLEYIYRRAGTSELSEKMPLPQLADGPWTLTEAGRLPLSALTSPDVSHASRKEKGTSNCILCIGIAGFHRMSHGHYSPKSGWKSASARSVVRTFLFLVSPHQSILQLSFVSVKYCRSTQFLRVPQCVLLAPFQFSI